MTYSAGYVPTTSAGYYNENQMSYASSTSATGGTGYYTAADADQWYDDGAGYEDLGDEYYYVDGPSHGHQGR